ncbi:3-deoxy-D-manno-octulosonic acid kinase [Motiliproteus sp. MSK22-1]|uniref:3-deoxy-D-manno-octulosonic acid kinase n=1 Tax=Motiliproteus sp. MSK22-1 TaxID=1897630 RepID=UPI000977B83E|nr:3-deoxy-D-manno-octulosonic acid kinase [Motiliproteus sp. MSK22-1]OMH28007.1 3-deoxy-D-manno-octulosonic acid kinase [Motiliproteus sp. MSK22-1]
MIFHDLKQGNTTIWVIPELVEHITPSWFDLNWWNNHGQQVNSAPGRGESYFLRYQSWSMVWRHYKRGGMAARVSQDRYLWTGLENNRAYAELMLTRQLLDMNLPVPRPLAGQIIREGLYYRADLITERLAGARSLADMLGAKEELPWAGIGATIARFHQVGLDHVDLNIRNILCNQANEVFLIDFDRCRMRDPALQWQQGNLARLKRSLNKLFPEQDHDQHWQQLVTAYTDKAP